MSKIDELDEIERIPIREILRYEVHSHLFARYITNNWLQKIIGEHIARKVVRKYKRYLYSLEMRNDVVIKIKVS